MFFKKFSMLYFINTFMLSICYALQDGGILGPYIGQLGKRVVGFKSLGRNIVRTYAKPTKPPTAAQLAQQAKFLICSLVAVKELINLVQPYWNYLVSNLSGYNSWMATNLKRVLTNVDFANLLITTGSYPSIPLDPSIDYDILTGIIRVFYDNNTPVNGDANDVAVVGVYVTDEWDPDNGFTILKSYTDVAHLRSEGGDAWLMNVETGLALADIQIYIGVRNPISAAKINTGTSNWINPVAA